MAYINIIVVIINIIVEDPFNPGTSTVEECAFPFRLSTVPEIQFIQP